MALELGADDFAAKPHNPRSLLKRVERATNFLNAQKREAVLKDVEYRDYLTGVLNRHGLYASMDMLKSEDEPLAVYIFALHGLKQINYKAGYAQGDKLISKFGLLLSSYFRKSDIVSRFSGNEFIVIIKKTESKESIFRRGEEICQRFKGECEKKSIMASCSAGIAVCSDKETIYEIIRSAKHALKCAKTDNKSVCFLWRG